ncbi:hypothetical protein AArcMg_1793 [Natrarchaeobaculum sulfurireducens]|uniref:Uncharacterized protein n=1 Tax=Natrarchaeobaculum sulfurireducens TaxID=2044521 RepID=A0A346PQK6_9EURY|nr:hypothetical protein AArcMg_1793 [Natrarchaeobaculum sulfurireducens]
MIAESLNVGGPRASELIDQLLESGRATRIDTGLYEHQYFNHRFRPGQLEVARNLEQSTDPQNAGDHG